MSGGYAVSANNTHARAGFRWGAPLKDTQELRVLLYRLGWAPVPGCPEVWTKMVNKWRDVKLLLGPQSVEICLHLPRLSQVSEPFLDYMFYVGVEMGTLIAVMQTLPVFASSVSSSPAGHNLTAPFLRPPQEVWDLLRRVREAQGGGGGEDDAGDGGEDDDDAGDDDEADEEEDDDEA